MHRSNIQMKSILLVDDSRSIRKLASSTLRGSGFDVIEAEDGKHGVEVAKSRDFDLVLTDLNMPNLDGVGLTMQIRALPHHTKTPILLVTTESQLTKKQAAKEAGANGWIVKPIQPTRLVEVVCQVLQRIEA